MHTQKVTQSVEMQDLLLKWTVSNVMYKLLFFKSQIFFLLWLNLKTGFNCISVTTKCKSTFRGQSEAQTFLLGKDGNNSKLQWKKIRQFNFRVFYYYVFHLLSKSLKIKHKFIRFLYRCEFCSLSLKDKHEVSVS